MDLVKYGCLDLNSLLVQEVENVNNEAYLYLEMMIFTCLGPYICGSHNLCNTGPCLNVSIFKLLFIRICPTKVVLCSKN